jgi:hypothetical protein
MEEVESLQNPDRMCKSRKNDHDMQPLMTSTKDIKLLLEPAFRKLLFISLSLLFPSTPFGGQVKSHAP